jgi:hypothetical protein
VSGHGTMSAYTYKFLTRAATGPLSGFAWPRPTGDGPGAWVEAAGALAPCANGAHLCRAGDLAHWLHDELWETEAAGDQIVGFDCLVVRRARLLRRIDAWHLGGAARFAEACAQHASEAAHRAPLGPVVDEVKAIIGDAFQSARMGYAAVGAYAAALAVAKLGDPAHQHDTYRRERAWQSEWIVRALIDARSGG